MSNVFNESIKKPSFLRHRRIKTSNELSINYMNMNSSNIKKQLTQNTNSNSFNNNMNNASMNNNNNNNNNNNTNNNTFNYTNKKQKQLQHIRSLLQRAKHSYYQQQNYSQVIQLLQQYLIYHPYDNQSLYLCAISYLNLTYPLQAIYKLQLISPSFINKCHSLLLLSLAYSKLEDYDKSLQYINQCITKYNKFEEAYCYRGKIYMKIELYQKAQEDFMYSLKINDRSFISRVGLADCMKRQGKYQQAIDYYEEALKYIDISNNNSINKNNNKIKQHKQHKQYKQDKQLKQDKQEPSANNPSTSLPFQQQQTHSDIILKQSMCFFFLQNYHKTIQLLQTLPLSQRTSQSYYYQGMSYLSLNKKPQSILNLQYCIRLQTNKRLIQKAFKVLIELYINDYQFYEALNLVKIVDNLNINANIGSNNQKQNQKGNNNNNQKKSSIKYWKNLVQGYHKKTSYHNNETQQNQQQYEQTNTKNQFMPSSSISPKHNQKRGNFLTRQSSQPIKHKCESLKYDKKSSISLNNRARSMFKNMHTLSQLTPKKYNNEGSKIKIKVKKFFRKMNSSQNNIIPKKSYHNNYNSQMPQPALKRPQYVVSLFSQQQCIFILPIILKFKSYSQFFLNNYLKSLQTHEQYQTYMKNIFGKQSTQILYNKLICEALLLNQTQLYKQAIDKFDEAIVEYQKYYNSIVVEPVLYKIALYLQMFIHSLQSNHNQAHKKQQREQSYKYLQIVLQLNRKYKKELDNHYLTHYYLSIMYYLCQKYTEAQEQLQRALKIVEQCTWKILYIKGVVEIVLQNYYDSIKQFTAGLIFQQNSQLYLGRAIAFLLQGSKRKQKQLQNNISLPSNTIDFTKLKKINLSSQSNNKNNSTASNKKQQVSSQIFIQNSFQDLQKYIQLQTNQQKVSLWVTKILFYNQAYEQAIKAMDKIQNIKKDEQLSEIQCWLKLYQGEFEQCAQIGYLIIDAFESNLLTQAHEKKILSSHNQSICNTLQGLKLSTDYQKWLIILHLYKKQKYSQLTKYIQKLLFQTLDTTQIIQLKYNLSLMYFLQNDKQKALNTLESIKKMINIVNNQKLWNRIKKIINLDFQEDECLSDLRQNIGNNDNYRLSEYLPYKLLQFKGEKVKKIFIKLSIPFPKFPKPNLNLHISHTFILKQLDLSVPMKKIQAPWIKRNKQKIQFTEEIIDAQTDFLKQTKQLNQHTSEFK